MCAFPWPQPYPQVLYEKWVEVLGQAADALEWEPAQASETTAAQRGTGQHNMAPACSGGGGAVRRGSPVGGKLFWVFPS